MKLLEYVFLEDVLPRWNLILEARDRSIKVETCPTLGTHAVNVLTMRQRELFTQSNRKSEELECFLPSDTKRDTKPLLFDTKFWQNLKN